VRDLDGSNGECAGGTGKKRDRENEIVFHQSRKTKIHITRMQIKEHPTKGCFICTLIHFITFTFFHKGLFLLFHKQKRLCLKK